MGGGAGDRGEVWLGCKYRLAASLSTSGTARNETEQIRGDREHKWVLSSILPTESQGAGRDHRILEVNKWLRRCQHEGCGFFDNRRMFWEGGLLSRSI